MTLYFKCKVKGNKIMTLCKYYPKIDFIVSSIKSKWLSRKSHIFLDSHLRYLFCLFILPI